MTQRYGASSASACLIVGVTSCTHVSRFVALEFHPFWDVDSKIGLLHADSKFSLEYKARTCG